VGRQARLAVVEGEAMENWNNWTVVNVAAKNKDAMIVMMPP
jgi:hypothetical protein